MTVHHKRHPKRTPGSGGLVLSNAVPALGVDGTQAAPSPNDTVAAPPAGFVTFFAPRDNLLCTVGLGPTPARITEGFGNWERIDRPHRYQRTQWKGGPDLTCVIQVVFDDLNGEVNQESSIRTLEAMGRATPPNRTPPRILVNGAGAVPYDFTTDPHRYWLVQNVQAVDTPQMLRRDDGPRTRQAMDVTLWSEDVGKVILPAQIHQATATTAATKVRKVPVRANDTLGAIAKRYGTTVAALKTLNKIRDPRAWLKTHQTILVAPHKA